VRFDAMLFDEDEANNQQHSRNGIKRRIEMNDRMRCEIREDQICHQAVVLLAKQSRSAYWISRWALAHG
jgi:hypothetical protein